MNTPLSSITVHKADSLGAIQVSYQAWLVAADETIAIVARWERPSLQTPYTTFARGDVLLELFPRERYYNVFALFDGSSLPAHIEPVQLVEPLAQAARQGEAPHSWPRYWRTQSGLTLPFKGFYANLTAPVQYDPEVRQLLWRDLHLDLWVPPHDSPLLLDEDAYHALHLESARPELYHALQRTRRWLWAHAQAHTGPFQTPLT